jgi:hypothetical protein
LPFADQGEALRRFDSFRRGLAAWGVSGDPLLKHAARLMGARGTPEEVLRRVRRVADDLNRSVLARHALVPALSVALGAMAPDDATVDATALRYLTMLQLLSTPSTPRDANPFELALECVPCPGEPGEVVALLHQTARHVAHGGAVHGAELATAAAFVKRFAY